MSPQAALESEVFRTYFLIVVGVLVVAGLALALLKWGFRKDVSSIRTTYKSWLFMVPLVMGCVFAGRVPTIIFFCILAGLGFNDFAPATGLYRDWPMTGTAYVCSISVGVARPPRHAAAGEPGDGANRL